MHLYKVVSFISFEINEDGGGGGILYVDESSYFNKALAEIDRQNPRNYNCTLLKSKKTTTNICLSLEKLHTVLREIIIDRANMKIVTVHLCNKKNMFDSKRTPDDINSSRCSSGHSFPKNFKEWLVHRERWHPERKLIRKIIADNIL